MRSRIKGVAWAFAGCCALGMAGCASGDAPMQQLSDTQKAMTQAQVSNVETNAPLEMKQAEDKINAAKSAIDNKDYDKARQLLDEAQADLDLANAKSASVKATRSAKAMRDTIETLRRQTDLPSETR